MRRARISFGDEEDDVRGYGAMRAPLRGGTGVFGDDGNGGNGGIGGTGVIGGKGGNGGVAFHGGDEELVDGAAPQQKRKRGRPPKADKAVGGAAVKETAPAISVR